jgi:beta-lactam-binding protein with PASTA domain
VLAVAFGTGYTATRALTNDDSAWLRKGDTVVYVNGPSGRFEAVVSDHPVALASSPLDPLEVVQDAAGQVYTADPVTHRVYMVDLDTMTPQPGPAGTAVLANSAGAFVVNSSARTITPVDPQTLAPGAPIKIPGPIASQTLAPDGTAYVGQTDGAVTSVTNGRAHTVRVAPPNASLDVTVVGSQPAAVDVTTGEIYPLNPTPSAGPPTTTIALPGQSGSPVEVEPNLPAGQLWLVRGDNLVSVNLSSAQTQTAGLSSGDQYGAPQVNGDRVYVPDDTAGEVLVFATSDLAQVGTIAVPTGAPGADDIEIVVRDGQVWIDNPTSQDAVVVSPNGTTEKIDKGSGNEVVNPSTPPPHPQPPRPSRPTHPTPPRPSPSPTPPSRPTSTTTPAPSGPPPAGTTGTTPTPVKTGAPPASASPTTTIASGAAPQVTGLDPATACATLQANSPPLTCTRQDQGEAPANTPAGVVYKQNPASGSTVTSGATVTITYYSSLAVPAPQSGEDPESYCERVDPLGLSCNPSNEGRGPPGAAIDVVYQTSPPAQTRVAAGTSVDAEYYSTQSGTVPNVDGMDVTTACATLEDGTVPFACSAQDEGEAPAGTQAGVVFDQRPAAGKAAASGAKVTIPYYSSLPVPAPLSGESPDAYCQRVDPLGLNCNPSDQGEGPPGAATNVVYGTDPQQGTSVSAGADVDADYYSSAPPATVTVPSCLGAAPGGCPATAGITWAAATQATEAGTAANACNTIWTQSPAANTTVAYNTTVTPSYDPNCAVPLYQYEGDTDENGVTNYDVFQLSTSAATPANYTATGQVGYVYPYVSGCAKTGGTTLYAWQYNPIQGVDRYYHFYYTTTPGWDHAGWTLDGAIACVFATAAAGTEAVSSIYENPPSVPGDHEWFVGTPSGSDLAWYEPDHPG